MPGVRISNSDELVWYVGDSSMRKLIKYLNKIGYHVNWTKVKKARRWAQTRGELVNMNNIKRGDTR